MDQLPERLLDNLTEQIAMKAVELGYKLPFYVTLVDSAEYALVINVEKDGPHIVAQTKPDVFRFPVHVMISDRTGKPGTYAVVESMRNKPTLRVVK